MHHHWQQQGRRLDTMTGQETCTTTNNTPESHKTFNQTLGVDTIHSVSVVIMNGTQVLLFRMYKPTKPAWNYCLTLPGGKTEPHVEREQTDARWTLARELKEELRDGLETTIEQVYDYICHHTIEIIKNRAWGHYNHASFVVRATTNLEQELSHFTNLTTVQVQEMQDQQSTVIPELLSLHWVDLLSLPQKGSDDDFEEFYNVCFDQKQVWKSDKLPAPLADYIARTLSLNMETLLRIGRNYHQHGSTNNKRRKLAQHSTLEEEQETEQEEK